MQSVHRPRQEHDLQWWADNDNDECARPEGVARAATEWLDAVDGAGDAYGRVHLQRKDAHGDYVAAYSPLSLAADADEEERLCRSHSLAQTSDVAESRVTDADCASAAGTPASIATPPASATAAAAAMDNDGHEAVFRWLDGDEHVHASSVSCSSDDADSLLEFGDAVPSVASVDDMALSGALSASMAESERLQARVRELEAQLSALQAQMRAQERRHKREMRKAAAASTPAKGPAAQREEVVMGFAYLTKKMAKRLAGYVTVSDGSALEGSATAPAAAAEAAEAAERSETDAAPARECATDAKRRTSVRRSPLEESDVSSSSSTSTSTSASAIPASKKRKIAGHGAVASPSSSSSSRSATAVAPRRAPRRSARVAKAAASTMMYSVFMFFGLLLVAPAMRMLGVVPPPPPPSFSSSSPTAAATAGAALRGIIDGADGTARAIPMDDALVLARSKALAPYDGDAANGVVTSVDARAYDGYRQCLMQCANTWSAALASGGDGSAFCDVSLLAVSAAVTPESS